MGAKPLSAADVTYVLRFGQDINHKRGCRNNTPLLVNTGVRKPRKTHGRLFGRCVFLRFTWVEDGARNGAAYLFVGLIGTARIET